MALFKKIYRADAVIHADIDKVWRVLIDLDNYHNWNPFTPKVETDFTLKSPVKLTVNLVPGKNPTLQTEFMTQYTAPFNLAWGFSWLLFLKAERVQSLLQTGSMTTYLTVDTIAGPLAPIVAAMYGKHISRGFSDVAKALKKHVELL